MHRAVDESAGIDHHQIRILIGTLDQVALGAKPSKYLFGVNERLGAPQGDKAYRRWALALAGEHLAQPVFSPFSPFSPFFSGACGAAKGNAVNMDRVWFCMFSCIWTKRFLLCSM